jgi:hypothetical protein
MTFAVPRPTDEWHAMRPHDGEPARGLRELFAPLDELLLRGGDPRLALDPACGLNAYGCGPSPSPDLLNFASSTASPISERAHARASAARDELMQSSIATGFEEAFDTRIEAMRETLRAHLGLSPADADIVFSPSGTDSQLHALFVARTLLGERLVTIVAGADQTGSGTAFTARGHHFSVHTAGGQPVQKDAPIAGLAGGSVALPLLDGCAEIARRADFDGVILDAVETAVAGGASVLLQIMDCSKLGWRAPSEACLGEIARRWPREVLIVVDACQMRLGRGRLRTYLDRGYLVLITGSKYFGGPAFSGALLIPAALARSIDQTATIASGLLDYANRSDWPAGWTRLRSRFASRQNLGQWLRWEAALEEIGAYYEVPDAFRAWAVSELSAGLASLIARSSSLRLVGPGLAKSATAISGAGDEEFTAATILPFTIHTGHGPLSAADGRMLYQALTQDIGDAIAGSERDRQFAAGHCLVGQPVALERLDGEPTAALRLCVGARHVSRMWSADPAVAQHHLSGELNRAAHVIAKIEWLLDRSSRAEITGRPDARR